MDSAFALIVPVGTFNLRDVVSDTCDTHPSVTDPADLIDHVLAAIAPNDYHEALRQALHSYISSFVVSNRPTRGVSWQPSSMSTKPKRKVGRPRHEVAAKFRASRHFSPFRKDWILLAEATVEDIRSIAAHRSRMAETYQLKSAWFTSIADAMIEHMADTFADLPEAIQLQVMHEEPEDPEVLG